eukprot:scaffold613139_cov29-Prasinocladus_malaysianus.AAC.1
MLEYPRHGTPTDCRSGACNLADVVIGYAKASFGSIAEAKLVSVLHVPTSLTNLPFVYQAHKRRQHQWQLRQKHCTQSAP